MRIKSKPQDFIVEEINTLKFDEEGKYSYYKLKKTNLETQSAIQKIADLWKINEKYINTAGTKDKVAITTQFISISQGPQKDIKTENLELTFLGRGRERLNLGSLEGNKFTIIVRKVTFNEKKIFINNFQEILKATFRFVNYYDDQRFGIEKNNHIVGKLLIKKQFKEAATLLVAREHYPYTKAKEYLKTQQNDYIGALRILPKKLLLMFVHAYQSWFWNETAKVHLEKKMKSGKTVEYSAGTLYFPSQKESHALKNIGIPIVGFDIEERDEEIEEILRDLMKKENITERDFLIKQMPEITAAGGRRDIFMNCKDVTVKIRDEETMEFSFALGKGSYATMVIKQIFI